MDQSLTLLNLLPLPPDKEDSPGAMPIEPRMVSQTPSSTSSGLSRAADHTQREDGDGSNLQIGTLSIQPLHPGP